MKLEEHGVTLCKDFNLPKPYPEGKETVQRRIKLPVTVADKVNLFIKLLNYQGYYCNTSDVFIFLFERLVEQIETLSKEEAEAYIEGIGNRLGRYERYTVWNR